MTRDKLEEVLKEKGEASFVEEQLLKGRPWIFASDDLYKEWLTRVSTELSLLKESIRIVGSAATGFSLSPLKPARPFREKANGPLKASDVDLALIDPSCFIRAWEQIVDLDRRRSRSVNDVVRCGVYWGFLSDFNVPPNTDPARKILKAKAVAGRTPPLRGRTINVRVYRRLDDLRGYHVSSLRSLRIELRGKRYED